MKHLPLILLSFWLLLLAGCGFLDAETAQNVVAAADAMEKAGLLATEEAEGLRQLVHHNAGSPWWQHLLTAIGSVAVAIGAIQRQRGPSATMDERITRLSAHQAAKRAKVAAKAAKAVRGERK